MQRSTINPMPHPQARYSSQSARPRRRACAREEGQALVELAFVLPILVLLVFGIIRFGLALNSANDETHLANEVARYATVNENPGCKEGEKCSLAGWGLSQADSYALKGLEVCINFLKNPSTETTKEIGDPVEVTLKGKIQWLPVLTVGPELTRKAVMRLEAAPTRYEAGCVKR
jgi:hypothetical protein